MTMRKLIQLSCERSKTMRKNIKTVIEAFQKAKPCYGQTCRTDGNQIFSYDMLIAERLKDGSIEIVNEYFSPSKTTTSHIRAVTEILG